MLDARLLHGPHPHDLRHAVPAFDDAAGARNEPEIAIDDDLGLDEHNVAATGAELTAAGGEHVLPAQWRPVRLAVTE